MPRTAYVNGLRRGGSLALVLPMTAMACVASLALARSSAQVQAATAHRIVTPPLVARLTLPPSAYAGAAAPFTDSM